MFKHGLPFILSTIALLLLLRNAALLVAADSYTLSWWMADGGGGASSAPGYVLNGTIGQADASPTLSGGDSQVTGGFWSETGMPVLPGEHRIYLPLVLK
jgi:hypothetical protein